MSDFTIIALISIIIVIGGQCGQRHSKIKNSKQIHAEVTTPDYFSGNELKCRLCHKDLNDWEQ